MMNTGLFLSCAWLLNENNRGYLQQPIPQARDSQISSLLKAWMALNEFDRKKSSSEILLEQQDTLLIYSERMAALAVRERNPDLITLGLVAIGVDGWERFDPRENLLIVPLHYDAAQRIGANPETIFTSVAQLLPETSAEGLRSFLRRSQPDKSLEAMGYVASSDGDGFRYRRTW
jgi:hypothetical protein